MKTKKIVWLSANIFGFKLLKGIFGEIEGKLGEIEIVTLSKTSTIRMYDGIPTEKWDEFNLPINYVINKEDLEETLLNLNPDLLVVAGWRTILTQKVLSLPTLGVVGFHPTLLPKGRGPAPIINTILEGWTESGVTMFYFDDKVDTGDIIGQEHFSIDQSDTATILYNNVIIAGQILSQKFLPQLIEGTAPRVVQDDSQATYFPKRNLDGNEISPTDSFETITRKIRAFAWPYNGAFIRSGSSRITISQVEVIKDEKTN